MESLKDQINYDTWFNIPRCVMDSTKNIQFYVENHDKVMDFLNDKVKSVMLHLEQNIMKVKIQIKEEAEESKKYVD